MLKMNPDELTALYDNLSALIAEGKEEEAREYLSHHLSRLPDDVKNQILGRMFFQAITDEVEESETIANMQEEGVAAIEALQALKKKLRDGEGAEA